MFDSAIVPREVLSVVDLLCLFSSILIQFINTFPYKWPQHAKVRTRVALANTWTNARIVVHATGCSRYKWLKAKRRLSINNAAPSPLLGIFFLARLDYEMKGIIKVTLTSKLPTK